MQKFFKSFFLFFLMSISFAFRNSLAGDLNTEKGKLEIWERECMEHITSKSKEYCYKIYEKYETSEGKEKEKLLEMLNKVRKNNYSLCLKAIKDKDLHNAKTICSTLCYKDFTDLKSCYLLAQLYLKIEENEKEGLKYLKKACDSGYGKACVEFVYKNSSEGKVNVGRYSDLLEKACVSEIPSGEACLFAGLKYFAENQQKTALKFFEESCKLKHKLGCLVKESALKCVRGDKFWCVSIENFASGQLEY